MNGAKKQKILPEEASCAQRAFAKNEAHSFCAPPQASGFAFSMDDPCQELAGFWGFCALRAALRSSSLPAASANFSETSRKN